ncbi:MAG: hypothetical protein H7145_17015 [Akkermansiaceae bacterium]|nr:hypothetical protein [Armatimonadota bacterium]
MNRKTTPDVPPADLLARCLATIPQSATTQTSMPRLFPDAGSRKRLAWLTIAAAVPVVTVLGVLPVKQWLDSEHHEKSAQEQTFPAKNETVPYVRIHRWQRQMMRNGLTAPDHRVLIYDREKGRSEWQTDDRYQRIKTPTDKTPFALIRANNGASYTEYWRAGKYCSIKQRKRTKRDGLFGFDWVYDPQSLASYYPGGKLLKQENVLWEGRSAERQEYTGIPDQNPAKTLRMASDWREIRRLELMVDIERVKRQQTGKSGEATPRDGDAKRSQTLEKRREYLEQQLLAMQRKIRYRTELPEWRSEVYVDKATGMVRCVRKWQMFRSTNQQYPDGILVEEQRLYYRQRPADADHFDIKRITTGVKLLYGTSKP